MFDLYIYPFGVKEKNEYSNLPGYYIGTPSRKVARTRGSDIFVIYYSNFTNLKRDEAVFLADLLPQATKLFFKTSGPITSTVKKTADFINGQIIKFNISRTERPNLIGAMQLLVLHDNEVYILHCGSASSYVLMKEKTRKYSEISGPTNGIGFSKTVKFHFHHATLEPGDRIVLSANPPNSWTEESLEGSTRLSISHLRRLLIQNSNRDFESVIIQVRPGNGSVHQLKLSGSEFEDSKEPERREPSTKTTRQPEVSNLAESQVDKKDERLDQENVSDQNDDRLTPETIASHNLPETNIEQVSSTLGKRNFDGEKNETTKRVSTGMLNEETKLQTSPLKSKAGTSKVDRGVPIAEEKQVDIAKKKFAISLVKFRTKWKSLSDSYHQLIDRLKRNIASIFSRAIPGEAGSGVSISPGSMLLIAVIIPIMVVTIATTVYFKNGRGQQHQALILEADQYVSLAIDEPEINKRILYFQEALNSLNQADAYGNSEASSEIRKMVLDQLDTLQGVSRVEVIQTVAGGLDQRINISEMTASYGEDVYALDSGTGRVLRLVATRPDYLVDTSFICGPGIIGNMIVGQLVDIEPITVTNNLNATLMGIDNNGNILFCVPGEPPIATSLEPPDLGWGNIQAIAFNGYSLFVLDTGENTRDIYSYASDGLSFNENPVSLFDQNIPENLEGVLDISSYQQDLYLLQNNGQLSQCSIGVGYIETNCDQNIGYGLIQQGQSRETVPTLANTEFTQMAITQPPDPSIYFMDTINSSVFHFSLALNMQKQLRPTMSTRVFAPKNELTSFTVTPAGTIHFAFGNELFFGTLP